MKLIGFSNPLALVLLLGLIPLWLWDKRSNADLPRARKKAVFIIRVLIYLFAVLALAGLRLYLPSDKMCVTYLIDDSDSTPAEHLKYAWSFMEKSVKSARYNDRVNVVLFGDDVYLDQSVEGNNRLERPSTSAKKDRTNIAQAISFAEALSMQDAIKRIVIISDGNENVGNAKDEGIVAGIQGTEIWTVPYPSEKHEEVMVKSVEIPERCNLDEPFDLKVVVASTTDSSVKMKIFLNGAPIASDTVKTHAGENIYYIPQKADKPGTYSYEVEIESENDRCVQNNRATSVTFIQGKPRVLYLSDFGTQPGPVANFIRDAGIEVYCGDPQHLPGDLASFRNYQAIIFSDVSALSLSQKQMSFLKSYVQDLGGGFIMIGGMNSFGIGGYYDTPVEEVLPVEMDVRKKKILPQAGLMLCIDKSGSMEEKEGEKVKVDLAKEAAIATLEVLTKQDILGVICFDSASKWVVPPQKVDNKETITSEIATIRAGGGTNLYPALEAAIDALKNTKTALKHIIILSDGRTEMGNFEKLIDDAVKARITVSTVSVGKDADIPFMEGLARSGKGRSYYTDNASLLPRIFVKDTFIASQSAYIEEQFTPKVLESHSSISGISFKSSPPMKGYCITAEKSLATVALESHKKDALLALWRTGLGKSVAFTSDEGGKWSRQWYGWDEASRFWQQVVRWTLASTGREDYTITTEIGPDSTCDFYVEATDESGSYRNFLDLKARVVTPEVESLDVPLHQVAPGKYKGEFQAKDPGNYIVNLMEAKSGALNIFAIPVPYSPEYKDKTDNVYLLNRLAESSGGRFSPRPEEIFVHPNKSAYTPKETWEKLLLLALLLFPFDVALRRVFLPARWFERLLKKKQAVSRVEEVAPSTMAALKSKKKEIEKQFAADAEIAKAGKTREALVASKEQRLEESRGEAGPGIREMPQVRERAEIREKPDVKPEVKPTLSQDSITYLERLKQAKRKAIDRKGE